MDQLDIIRRTIEEHHKVRTHLRLVGEAVNDMEAVFSLRQAETAWEQSSQENATRNVERMKQVLFQLKEGLHNHFGFEEKYLPPVLGTNLMKALLLEHRDIEERLEKCSSSCVEDINRLSREQLLTFRATMQERIDDLSSHIENHASREETILLMIEKALKQEQAV